MSSHSTKSNADAGNEQQVNEDDLQMVNQTSISWASGLGEGKSGTGNIDG